MWGGLAWNSENEKELLDEDQGRGELWAERMVCAKALRWDELGVGSQTNRKANVAGPGCGCGCVGETWGPTSRLLDAIQFSSGRLLIVRKRLDYPLNPTLSQLLVL